MGAIPLVLVGPLASFYGDTMSTFCELCNEEERFGAMRLAFAEEYVKNEGSRRCEDRSSALQNVVQSVLTPQEISNFKSIEQIRKEILRQEPVADAKQKVKK